MKNKTVLVIGSKGNIGKKLVARLKTRKFNVLESDILPGWEGYFMADIKICGSYKAFNKKPKVVFLLSAMVSRVTCDKQKFND